MASSRISFTSRTTEASWAISDSSEPSVSMPSSSSTSSSSERLGHQALDRLAADAQVLLDQLGDLVAAGQDGRHEQPRGGADFVQRIQVERIAGGDDQRAVAAADREQRLAVDQLLRKILQQLPQCLFVVHDGQIDVLQSDRLADGAQRDLFADKAQLDRGIQHRRAVGLAGLVQLPLIEQTAL